MKQSGKLQVYW